MSKAGRHCGCGLGAVGAAWRPTSWRGAVRACLGSTVSRRRTTAGSSHGETRITRQGVGEGEDYAPLALRSHAIWRELEAQTGRSLMLACGLLVLGPGHGQTPHHGKTDFVRRSAEVAARFDVAHELVGAAEIAHRYPQLSLTGDEIGYFEPGGGLVYPERCVETQLGEARRLGAELAYGQRVLSLEPTAAGVRVVTETDAHEAGKVVLCAEAPGRQGWPGQRCLRWSCSRRSCTRAPPTTWPTMRRTASRPSSGCMAKRPRTCSTASR